MERLTPSRLRVNLYRILDRVLANGQPVEIHRKGQRLRIVAERNAKLEQLKPHPDYLNVAPGKLVHVDWSDEWRP